MIFNIKVVEIEGIGCASIALVLERLLKMRCSWFLSVQVSIYFGNILGF